MTGAGRLDGRASREPGGAENTTPAPATIVAIVGNPNTGKTTLFNRLTGARQRVGNYPGITVEKVTGALRLDASRAVTLLDLPGTYSLAAASDDEQVVIDVLSGHSPDTERPRLVVCVVDASNLRRNLFLVSQIAETGTPAVIALNMVDAAVAHGIEVDAGRLAARLGVPVVATVASRGVGVDALRAAIAEALAQQPRFPAVPWPAPVCGERDQLRATVGDSTGRVLTEAEALRLLFDLDTRLLHRLGWPAGDAAIERSRAALAEAGLDPASVEARLRYQHSAADQLLPSGRADAVLVLLAPLSSRSSSAMRSTSCWMRGASSSAVQRGLMCCGQFTSQASTWNRKARSGRAW